MNWISVKNRLPKNDVWVLVCGMSGSYYTTKGMKKIISICSYDYKYKEWEFQTASGYEFEHDIDLKTITHWMPLPDLPKEE